MLRPVTSTFQAVVMLCCLLLQLMTGVIAGEFTVFSKAFASYSNLMLPGPVNASNDKITVIAHIERLRLLDVLEVEQSIKFFVDVRLSWTDPAIRWDPETDKQKTSSIKVPEDTVWSPDITIFSAVSKTFPIPSSRRVLRVNYDGAIVKSTAQIILNPCSLNVNKFPFDSQHCQFRIGPWAYDNSEVLLRPYTSTTLNISDQEKFRGNSEWTLSSIEVQAYADDSYGKGQVYDEVSLGVMTLISMTMVLETFSSAMPKTANLPLLGIYVLAEELVCACATLVTVSLSLAHERATTRRWTVPKCFAKGLLWHSYDDRIRMRTASIQPNHWSPSFLTPHLARISTHLAEMQSDESISAQWMRVFDRLDLAAMAIFQILNVIINLAILIGGS